MLIYSINKSFIFTNVLLMFHVTVIRSQCNTSWR